jgi:anti-anti-sigma regulatory factor
VIRFEEYPDALAPDGPPCCVARIDDEVQSGEWPIVARDLVARIREGTNLVILDLAEQSAVDAGAVRALIGVQAELRLRGGRLVIVCPTGTAPRRGIEATGLHHGLTLVDDLPRATHALGDVAATPAAPGAPDGLPDASAVSPPRA